MSGSGTILGLGVFIAGVLLQVSESGAVARTATEAAEWVLTDPQAADLGLMLTLRSCPFVPSHARQKLRTALISTLMQVGPNEDVPLTLDQRRALRWMILEPDIDLAVSALSALEHIGNHADCVTVGRLVSHNSGAPPEPVVARVRQILPAMEQRLRIARQDTALLRPSSAPDEESLLRPQSAPDADTLLRRVESLSDTP
jgi:hypothetical protein